MISKLFAIAATSPAAPGAAIAGYARGLESYDEFIIDAVLTEATGGTLDVILERKVTDNIWVEWLRFTQLDAGSAVHRFSTSTRGQAAALAAQLTAVGAGDDTTPAALTIAEGAFIGGHPGNELRACFTAGGSTSAGAAQAIYITARQGAF